ncbi:hypothetical protein HUJ04_003879 [Dendroctonus ponderosae]|nr:hypothetical protein HUJ04_003879 [Dendroctonus ponderosae]
MVNILIGCTGSVATIKLPHLIQEIYQQFEKIHHNIKIRVVTTEHAKHFFDPKDLGNVDVFCDEDEWSAWSKRGDEVLHVELGKWADILLIAPLDANSLGKIATLMTPTEDKDEGKKDLFYDTLDRKLAQLAKQYMSLGRFHCENWTTKGAKTSCGHAQPARCFPPQWSESGRSCSK